MITEKKRGMGLRCVQVLLIFVNGIFALLGLVLLVIGCIAKFGSDSIEQHMSSWLSGTSSVLRSAGGSSDITNFDLGVYLGTQALTLLAVGAFFMIVSLVGCCGGIGKIRCLLILYSVILLVLILCELAILIAVFGFTDELKEHVKPTMVASIKDEYRGIKGNDAITVGWNVLMIVFSCCGVDSSSDFTGASQWDRKYVTPATPTSQPGVTDPPITVTLQTPIACCKTKGDFPDVTLLYPNDVTCAISPNVTSSNMDKGCVDEIINFYKQEDRYLYMVGGGAVIVLSELIMFLLVIGLLVALRKRDKFDRELQRMFND